LRSPSPRTLAKADQHDWNSDEFLGFNLKLLGKKSKKNVLVSAGKMSDKERMFPGPPEALQAQCRAVRHPRHVPVPEAEGD
jgi:hypothetical protein